MAKKLTIIEMLRPTVIANKDVFPGDELTVGEDCTEQEARLVVSLGKARAVPESNSNDIVDAIGELDPEDEELWTQGGKPQVEALEALLGYPVSGKQRDEAWNIFKKASE